MSREKMTAMLAELREERTPILQKLAGLDRTIGLIEDAIRTFGAPSDATAAAPLFELSPDPSQALAPMRLRRVCGGCSQGDFDTWIVKLLGFHEHPLAAEQILALAKADPRMNVGGRDMLANLTTKLARAVKDGVVMRLEGGRRGVNRWALAVAQAAQ